MIDNQPLVSYIDALTNEQKQLFDSLRRLIHQAYPAVQETLFAKQPYFYLSEHQHIKFHYRPSIMMSFFGNHVNIFTTANVVYQDRLPQYHFTDKHTLQINLGQPLDHTSLVSLFTDSLIENK